jgi:predicted 3-demethylubiquinone-9 3-methyltransferase (glyoxalase superfamily)
MPTTFTWKVANLERETSDGYVYTVHYTVNAADEAYSAGAYGSIGLERGEELIPYANLTEETVIGWVKDKFGTEKVTEIEEALQAQLDEQHAPSKATGVPWAG